MGLMRFLIIFPLLWLSLPRPAAAQFDGDGLKGVYYGSVSLTNPVATVIDPIVSFRWGGCPPEPNMSVSLFSVKWTGWLEPRYSESCTLITEVTGGVSVIVNGVTLISSWTDTTQYQSGTISLSLGVTVPIEVDYFSGGANPSTTEMQLIWQSHSQPEEFIPRECLFSGAPITPSPTPQAPSGCQFSPSLTDQLGGWGWNQGPAWNGVNKIAYGNTFGATAAFKTLWDASNLYLGVTVTDSQLTPTGNGLAWEHSAVEVYIDATDSKSQTLLPSDFQYFFGWNDSTPIEMNNRTAGVTVQSTTIPNGYLMEVSIPWTTLGLSAPTPGQALGFDLGVDVNHNGGNCRDGQLMWNGGFDNYVDTSRYGTITLANACPTPVSTPPAPAPEPLCLFQPLQRPEREFRLHHGGVGDGPYQGPQCLGEPGGGNRATPSQPDYSPASWT